MLLQEVNNLACFQYFLAMDEQDEVVRGFFQSVQVSGRQAMSAE